mmetsp:Transcript_73119/g.219568  ORF Transcript_73119/g.219568 Transcript_73119/m.219568 type:complete len:336 (-) Transcript_73119:107-1114(-)
MIDTYEMRAATDPTSEVPVSQLVPTDEIEMAPAARPPDVITQTRLQFATQVKASKCTAIKAVQAGRPAEGFHEFMAGVMAAASGCNLILFWMWMVNSESTTQVMWMLMYLFKECPEYSDKLKALAYDAACIARKHVDAKMRPGVLPATSSAYPLYERIAQLKFFVDNMHFKNHNENDTFCVENCDPMLFPEYSQGTNTEACEQTFKWLGRFKVIVNSMGLSRATFFLSVMFYEHNRRVIKKHCFSLTIMPAARLAEVRAAYRLPPAAPDQAARSELAALLLANTRDWDANALAAFVAHAATAGPSEQQGNKRPRGAGSTRPGGGKASKEAKAGRG